MKKQIFYLGNAVLLATIIFFIGLFFVSYRFSPFGLAGFALSSGSMSPAIRPGSLVVVRRQKAYHLGDIIAFHPGPNSPQVVVHRIAKVLNRPTTFSTQGDANNIADPAPIAVQQVIGRVVFILPVLGYFCLFLKTRAGMFFFIILPACLIIFGELASIKKEINNPVIHRKFKPKQSGSN